MVPEGATSGPIKVVKNGENSEPTGEFTIASPAWYLAEGSSAWGYQASINIENPNDSEVTCAVTYMTSNGPRRLKRADNLFRGENDDRLLQGQ